MEMVKGSNISNSPVLLRFPKTREGRREAALLYVLLTYNPRTWNARMRKRLREQLTASEIANVAEHFHDGGEPRT